MVEGADERLIAFAERLADAAGSAVRPHFRAAAEAHNKAGAGDPFDPVTVADRAAEAAMRRLIATYYPDHKVYGEEEGGALSDDHPTWVLDPIDGTRAFILGLPMWGTLIALDLGSGPVLGIMDQPFTGERFIGHDGSAQFIHGGQKRRLSTRRCGELGAAMLAATSPDMFTAPEEQKGFSALKAKVRLTRFGCDCYAYAMLAMGLIDLVVEANMRPFDIQALIPIIEGAGGMVTTWTGESARHGGRILASGDPKMHAAALTILNAA